MNGNHSRSALAISVTLALALILPAALPAATSAKIDANVDAALANFTKEVKGGAEFLRSAKGVLVLAGVVKAGFVVGGEYGEGALRVAGKTVDYYSIASGSLGFQFGAQKKDVILVFMEDQALKKFRESSGWKAGVDGSIALIDIGVGGSIDSMNVKAPIVGFVVGQKGLMVNVTLEGSKISKLDKSK
jgi:lipid-binding SYLF domain-containing protein